MNESEKRLLEDLTTLWVQHARILEMVILRAVKRGMPPATAKAIYDQSVADAYRPEMAGMPPVGPISS